MEPLHWTIYTHNTAQHGHCTHCLLTAEHTGASLGCSVSRTSTAHSRLIANRTHDTNREDYHHSAIISALLTIRRTARSQLVVPPASRRRRLRRMMMIISPCLPAPASWRVSCLVHRARGTTTRHQFRCSAG